MKDFQKPSVSYVQTDRPTDKVIQRGALKDKEGFE